LDIDNSQVQGANGEGEEGTPLKKECPLPYALTIVTTATHAEVLIIVESVDSVIKLARLLPSF
jgi:hypothetical protein